MQFLSFPLNEATVYVAVASTADKRLLLQLRCSAWCPAREIPELLPVIVPVVEKVCCR